PVAGVLEALMLRRLETVTRERGVGEAASRSNLESRVVGGTCRRVGCEGPVNPLGETRGDMRKLGLVSLMIGAFLLVAATAVAGNVHFKNGGGPFPTISGSSDETLTVSGTLVGLGVSPG